MGRNSTDAFITDAQCYGNIATPLVRDVSKKTYVLVCSSVPKIMG